MDSARCRYQVLFCGTQQLSHTVARWCWLGRKGTHQNAFADNSVAEPTGFENVTAAQRAAAARALGITVPAWRAGATPYFDLNPSGSIDTNACVLLWRDPSLISQHT